MRVDGSLATKAGQNVSVEAAIHVESPRRFVSRGGEKLEHALDVFELTVRGVNALDVGASTGGFTDCLLQRGAAHVTAVDVGYGQLDWRLRNDPRVTVMERTNFRLLPDDAFLDGFDIIVVDASFISSETIVARAERYLKVDGTIVVLVKPQFEAGRERLGAGGVVRDPGVHRAILRQARGAFQALGLGVEFVTGSPLYGPAGNREFLVALRRGAESIDDARIDAVLAELPAR